MGVLLAVIAIHRNLAPILHCRQRRPRDNIIIVDDNGDVELFRGAVVADAEGGSSPRAEGAYSTQLTH